MNTPLARFPNAANKKSAAVARPGTRGTLFYLIAGLACGLGAISVVCGLLLVRHATAQPSAPVQSVVQTPPALVIAAPVAKPETAAAAEPFAAPAAAEIVPAQTQKPVRTVSTVARARISAVKVRGTVTEEDEKAEAAGGGEAEEDATVEAAEDDKPDAKEAAIEAAGAEADGAAEIRRPGKLKKVVSSLLRPFARKKNAGDQ